MTLREQKEQLERVPRWRGYAQDRTLSAYERLTAAYTCSKILYATGQFADGQEFILRRLWERIEDDACRVSLDVEDTVKRLVNP